MDNIREKRLTKVTPQNEFIFKKEAAKWYELGIIPKELYLKIQRKNYVKGEL